MTLHRPNPDPLRQQIVEGEARLTELEAAQAAAKEQLARLRSDLAALERPTTELPVLAPVRPPLSKNEKVALFRSLFAGRVDVFPKLWRNPKTRKQGYAPACANEWVRGICEKPRIKCGECPNQAFLQLTDRVIVDHLQGRHVAGVYPLLEDETCWFLAVDFDKGHWQEDVAAYVATCRRFGLTPAVERSRSGNGAHVWFFFSATVPASSARKMGSYLITETAAARPQLPMDSYDRLFPNQDTMPRGGFGNLIALPLQFEARERGNTVFVDDAWGPFPEQWAHLAALPRINAARVDELAREASGRGMVLGVRTADTAADDKTELPWLRLPSRQRPEPLIDGPLPSEVRAVLAQQLFVEKAGLPPALVNAINRLAAFENPQFHERQAMRLSTALIPRVISCAEGLPEHIGLPRGCASALEDLLYRHGIALAVENQTIQGQRLALEFHGELTALQQQGVRALLGHDTGVFVAPPRNRKDRGRCPPDREPRPQRPRYRPPHPARRPMACATGPLPRSEARRRRPDRGRETQGHRSGGRRDDPEPGATRGCR